MKTNQSGQGLIEYIFVITVIAIISLGVMGLFSTNLRTLISDTIEQLAGKEQSQAEEPSQITDIPSLPVEESTDTEL